MQISVMCGLTEDGILKAVSIGSLSRYIVLVEVHEDDPASVFEKMMTSQAILKESWAYSGVLRPPFENCCPRAHLWGGAVVEPSRRWSTQQRSSHFSDHTCSCFCLGYFSSLPTLSPEFYFCSSVSTHADVSFLEIIWIVSFPCSQPSAGPHHV